MNSLQRMYMNSEFPVDQLSLSDNTICVKYEVSVERAWAVGRTPGRPPVSGCRRKMSATDRRCGWSATGWRDAVLAVGKGCGVWAAAAAAALLRVG